MLNKKTLSTLAAAALVAMAGSAQAADFVVDLTGFEVWGSFSNPSNSSALISVPVGTEITGFSYVGLTYTSFSPSWMNEIVLSVEHPDGYALGYMDEYMELADSSSGTYGPISGSWGDISPDGGPWIATTGQVRVYLYDTFQDAGLNARVLAGSLIVHTDAAPVPEPATYGMMGLGLLGVGALVRRRQRAAA